MMTKDSTTAILIRRTLGSLIVLLVASGCTPACSSTARNGTPVQRPLLERPFTGPRFPEHSNPKTRSRPGIACSPASESDNGRSTSPDTCSRYVAVLISGCP